MLLLLLVMVAMVLSLFLLVCRLPEGDIVPPPEGGWTDVRYQSNVPHFARPTATQVSVCASVRAWGIDRQMGRQTDRLR